MRFSPYLLAVLLILFISPVSTASAQANESRRWSDASGQFGVEGKLISTDTDLIVLENKSGDLIALRREQLSSVDQKFVDQFDAKQKSSSVRKIDSEWKLGDGDVVAGRLMGFGSQDLIVKRERGDIWVNNRRLDNLPAAYRKILPNVVQAIDKKRIEDVDDLERHLVAIGAGPYEYSVEGVQIDLKTWGTITIPLSLLTTDEAAEIAPGFKRWKASQEEDVSEQDRYETANRERLALQGRDRLRQQKRSARQRQMQMMELSLLSAASGVSDIWEVQIRSPYQYGYGRTVLVNAQNSLQAKQLVAQKYARWQIGAIAKRSY
ncbi:SHD1 domain-containing protein [Planctomycetes bacterium K23_9]|uniref:SLA1 homology domain-containing protein n=1 Tax=Stieleria marina TaxID=1930275 RepID=A0A517NQ65_9BACT|nr:hypothetical protein K239x_12080 [Planctomycetes bacterium K23_9]